MKCCGTVLRIGVFLVIAIFAVACQRKSHIASTPSPSPAVMPSVTPSESNTAKAQPTSPIRQIDFENFIYPHLPTDKCSMKNVRLIKGRYDAPANIAGTHPAVDCWSVALGKVTYGDVTADGEEEAFVQLYAELGGTEGAEDIYIYTLKGRNPKLLWKFATGDRAEGGLRRIAAEDGKLVVELFGVGTAIGKKLYGTEETGACCPKHFTRTRYRWSGTRFQPEGRGEVFENPSGSSAPV